MTMPYDERRARIERTRARLVAILGDVASLVDARSRERCPYRRLDDGCTFRGGCRNQLVRDGARHCTGGPLCGAPAVDGGGPCA